MQIIVVGDEQQQQALPATQVGAAKINRINSLDELEKCSDTDVLVDLLFVKSTDRIERLLKAAQFVVINSVVETLADTHPSFVRINGWNGFLTSPVIEAASATEANKQGVEATFAVFGKTLQWLPDQPGFVTARVVSMIINEAYLALGEGISTKAEIDTAMKLGTAYPYGPFAWAEMIGVQRVVNLLQKLAQQEPKYMPAELLAQPIQL